MSGLTEEEKAMIQSVMMKAQEFEKGAPSTMPSPKPSSQTAATSQQAFQNKPTPQFQPQPQMQPHRQQQGDSRPQGGIDSSGFQQKGGGGISQTMTQGQRPSGSNQTIQQPNSSDLNFGFNQQQSQLQQQRKQQLPQQVNPSQPINQQIRPTSSSSQSQNQQQQYQQQQPQNFQPQQNQQHQPPQQAGLSYPNESNMDQMQPQQQQQQDYFQGQQQPQKDNVLVNHQQQSDNSLTMNSQQNNQQGLIQNQHQPFIRNQANLDQNINNNAYPAQQQGRQQPQIPQGQQQQQPFIHDGLNQSHHHSQHQQLQNQQQQQQQANQLNQQAQQQQLIQQQNQLNQENGFMFNNQNLQDFSTSQSKIGQQQSTRLMADNNNCNMINNSNNNNLYNTNANNNNNINGSNDSNLFNNNQQGLMNADQSSTMFDNNMSDQRLDEQLADSYGSLSENEELHSSSQLIQESNYPNNNITSMDVNNIYHQDSSSNHLRNDLSNNNNSSSNSNFNSNQFNQRLNDQYGNQNQFNNSGFPKQQQQQQLQQSTHPQHILPNPHSLQSQQSLQQQQQQQHKPNSGPIVNNQQPFAYQTDQFAVTSHSQSQLPQLQSQQPGSLTGLNNQQHQQLLQNQQPQQHQSQHQLSQQASGTIKPFLDPASLFNQDNIDSNLQSTSVSQNPMIQGPSSTTITPTGASFRHLPNQADIVSQNQMKANLQYQQQQQQPANPQQLVDQSQQQFQLQPLNQPTSSYSSNQYDSNMSFGRPNENKINRDFQEYQGSEVIQVNQANQQQQMLSNSMGIKSLPGTTYQQPMKESYSEANRFVSPFQQSTNNPSNNSNLVRGSNARPNLLQGKPSDTNSTTLTGLIPRTIPLQSVRDQLSSSISLSNPPATANSSSSNIEVSSLSSSTALIVTPNQQSINCISNSSSSNSTAVSTSSAATKHKNSSLSILSQGNPLILGSTINSMSSQELTRGASNHLINSNFINNNSINSNNNNANNNVNSYSQQQIHSQQMKRIEIGECWSPVSELSPIQDVSPSIEAAEQRSMQQHQQEQPLTAAIHSNVHLTKLNDEYGNGLHRVTSGTISGMLADFNKQMEALSTVSPTDERSSIVQQQQQQSARRSSLSRLQLVQTSSAPESRSRSGSLTTIGTNAIHSQSQPYSALVSSLNPSITTSVTTTTTSSGHQSVVLVSSSSRPSSSSSALNSHNLIKSLQGLSSTSATMTAATTTTTSTSTTTSSTTGTTTVMTGTHKGLGTLNSVSTTSKPDGPMLNESSILVTPGNLQLLAQSLPPAQLAIPRTVTHQVELAVSPVVEQTLQQQQLLIQQQQQLIMLQKELFQQQQQQHHQQEQLEKQEQLQKEQEKKKVKQQSTTTQSHASQGTSEQQPVASSTSKSSSGSQQSHQSTSTSGHTSIDHHQTPVSSTSTSAVVSSTHNQRHSQFTGHSSAPATPNRKDRRRLPQPTIEEIQGAVQAISNQASSSTAHSHGSSLTSNKTTLTASSVSQQFLGSRPISPLIPRKNQVIGVPIIPHMSRSRPTPASTVLTMATPTLVSSSLAANSSLLDPRHFRGISPLSMLDETQSEAGGLKNKRRLPLVPLDEEPVTAAAVSRKLIKDRLMGKTPGGAGNLSCKSVPLLRSASSLDHTPSIGVGLGSLNKDAQGSTGLPLRSRPHSGPISPFSSLSDIANLINSSASGLAGLDLHRPQTPINTLRSSLTAGSGPSHLPTSLANYLGVNVPGGANTSSGPTSFYSLNYKSPFVTSSLPSSSPITSPLSGALGLGSGGGYIKSLKSQLKDELKSVVDERRRILDAREINRDKQDFYRRSETDLQSLYDPNYSEAEAFLARRGLLNRRRPLGGLRRGDTLDPKALGTYSSSLLQDPSMFSTGLSGSIGLTPEFKSYEYEFLDPGSTSSLAYPGLLASSLLNTGRSPFGGPASNLRRPVSSLGVLGSGLNSTDMAYGLRDRLTNGELDPGLRESFIPNFMDNVGDGSRLLGMGSNSNRFRRRSEGSLEETLLHYDPYNALSLSGVRGYDDLRTNLNSSMVGGPTGYRTRPLLGSIGPAHSWHPSPYASEDEDDKLTREEKAAKVRAEIARRRAQLMETGRAVADDLGGGGKYNVGPTGHHPSYYSRDQTQQYNSSAYRRQIGAGNGLMAGEDYSPSGYMDDYYTPGNRCVHGSPTHVRRSRMARDGLYSRSLDTGYEDYTAAPSHHHHDQQHQQQQQQAYDEYGYYNRGNGINRQVPTDYQVNYSGLNVANHNLPSQGQPLPAIKRPKYPFPVKRILLIRDPKERAHGGNCYGLRLIGGQEIPGTDQVGTFVEKTITGGAVDSLGEIREGDQVLEWNGLPLTGLSNEEVQRLVSASNNAEEVELVIRRDFNLFDGRYDYNSYNQCQAATTEADFYVNNRGQMSQGVTAGSADGGQYYQSP